MVGAVPATQQAHGGASDSYFAGDGGGQQQVGGGYTQQPQMQAQQGPQYTQQPPSYETKGSGNAVGDAADKQTFEQSFKIEKPKYNDIWAGVLLIVVFLGFAAISGITLQGYASTKGVNGNGIYGGNTSFGLTTNTVILFAFVLATAFVISLVYLLVIRTFTKQFIWITGILQIVFGIGTAIFYFIRHYYSAAIVFVIFAIFYIICFISWIPRIPFSVVMLQTAIDVARKHGHVFLVSLLGGFAAMAFGAWYSVTLVAIYVKYEPGGNNPSCANGKGGCSSGKVIGLIVFVTFAGFWITEWLKNTIHVAISGVYGSWYFCSRNFPKGATRGALKRALTTSFGSISFGSLLVSLIQLLRQAVSVAQSQEAANGSIVGQICFCLLGCIIGLINWAIEFLNQYAFSFIALYGKSYIAAAKETWTLIKDRGIDALINDCLIDPVLSMGAVFVGYLCALLSYLYLIFTKPAYNSNGDFTPVVMAFSFLIGLQICNVFMVPLKSGVSTIFVAAAFNPDVMVRDHPDLYARMVSVYPHVQQAIHA